MPISTITDVLSSPGLIASVVAIVGGTALAIYFTAPGRAKAKQLRHPDRPLRYGSWDGPGTGPQYGTTPARPAPAYRARPGRPPKPGYGAQTMFGTRPARPGQRVESGVGADGTPDGSLDAAGTGSVGAAPMPVTAEHLSTRFSDLAGLDEAVTELTEVREYLSDPERFKAVGAEMPRGILLHGPPGCGKTLLARALAGETGVPFYGVSAASFVEQFVGLGAARVRQLFEAAKKSAPSIVFLDELDAIGRSRDNGSAGGREFDHTLNQLLVELDGFTGSSGVLLIGATNRPELIDAALLRPGRFDRRIQVERPDRHGREQILRLHASKRPVSSLVRWGDVATDTAGLSGSELSNIVNEASLLAARRHQASVLPEDIWEAVARVAGGTGSSSRLIGDEERQLRAFHEAGHALLTLLLRGMRPPTRISIVSRKGAFDRSAWSAPEDREILTKRELMAQLIVLLGGRAAELQTFGEPSTRAEDDLQYAAALARRMVEQWAMTGRFELAGAERDKKMPYLEGSAGGNEVRALLQGAEHAAKTILHDNEKSLKAIAMALVDKETLSATELAELHIGGPRARRRAAAGEVVDAEATPKAALFDHAASPERRSGTGTGLAERSEADRHRAVQEWRDRFGSGAQEAG